MHYLDFFLLDEPTKRDEVEGRCTFSVDGVAFARDGARAVNIIN